MQQGEHAQQGFVRVDVFVGGPAAEDLTLLVEGEGPAAEAVRLLRSQVRVGSTSTMCWERAKRKN